MISVASYASEEPTVLIFGDSLSAGYGIDIDSSWPSLLQQRLQEQGYEHRVVNASISGETSSGGAERIRGALERFAPDLVVIELGGNDGLRGFPPARMKSNLESMITASLDSGAGVALLGIRIPPNYGARYTQTFEAVFDQLASQYDLPFMDFFMDGIALNAELMQSDGIHPTAEAQPRLLDNAWPAIKQALDARRHCEPRIAAGCLSNPQ